MLPQPGNTLRLTIDVGLQRAAEKALRDAIAAARDAGETYADGGAIVALDPRTGAVLALASNPTYQPSVYVSRDPAKLAPLQNEKVAAADELPRRSTARSTASTRPGSVWKPVTALAAMEEGILSPTESLLCSPVFDYYQQPFKNWDPYVNQPMELTQALAESCDTYFYRVGARFYSLPASRGADAPALGLRGSASARRPGSTSAPRTPGSCRRRTGAARPSAARRAPGTSTGSGSRATRCSSRSARATSR